MYPCGCPAPCCWSTGPRSRRTPPASSWPPPRRGGRAGSRTGSARPGSCSPGGCLHITHNIVNERDRLRTNRFLGYNNLGMTLGWRQSGHVDIFCKVACWIYRGRVLWCECSYWATGGTMSSWCLADRWYLIFQSQKVYYLSSPTVICIILLKGIH